MSLAASPRSPAVHEPPQLALEPARTEADALASIVRDLAAAAGGDELVQRIVEHARTLTESDSSALACPEKGDDGFRIVAVAGDPRPSPAGRKLRRDDSLLRQVLVTGAPASATDYAGDDRVGPCPRHDARAAGVGAAAAAPVRARDETVAALFVGRCATRAYTAGQLQLLGRLADLVAVAMVIILDDNGRAREAPAQREREERFRRDAEQRLLAFEMLTAQMAEAFAVVDLDGGVSLANPAGVRLFGLSLVGEQPSMIGIARATDLRYLDGRPIEPDDLAYSRAVRGEVVRDFEHLRREPGTGRQLAALASAAPIRGADGEIVGALCVVSDVTDRWRAQQRLARLNRFYSVLSEINETIVRVRDRSLLLTEACRVVVQRGLFRVAWIGLVDQDTLDVHPVTSWGVPMSYLTRLRISARDEPSGWGPVGVAIRTGRPDVRGDVSLDERMRPWREVLLERGYQAAASFPLRVGPRIIGALTVVAGHSGEFEPGETAVLERLASDLGFALEALETDERLRLQTTLLECQSEAALDGIVTISSEGRVLSFNRRFIEMWEIPDEVARTQDRRLYREHLAQQLEDPERFCARWVFHDAHPSFVGRQVLRLKDGRTIDRYGTPVRSRDGEFIGRVLYFRDVTEEQRAERERAELLERLADRERSLRDLVQRVLVAQEEERRHLAYEVHDGVAQVATAAQQHLEAYAHRFRPRSAQAEAALDEALQLARHTVMEARRVIGDLRPTELDDFGLATALRLQVRALGAAGWDATYWDSLEGSRLDPMLETALFRVAQEALTNVRKHAGPARVVVSLRPDGEHVRLEIRDWGRGFELRAPSPTDQPGEKIGLRGMQERVAFFGGSFELTSAPGEGTRVVACVPLSWGNVH